MNSEGCGEKEKTEKKKGKKKEKERKEKTFYYDLWCTHPPNGCLGISKQCQVSSVPYVNCALRHSLARDVVFGIFTPNRFYYQAQFCLPDFFCSTFSWYFTFDFWPINVWITWTVSDLNWPSWLRLEHDLVHVQ